MKTRSSFWKPKCDTVSTLSLQPLDFCATARNCEPDYRIKNVQFNTFASFLIGQLVPG